MDRDISARFFKIVEVGGDGTRFAAALAALQSLPEIARNKQVRGGIEMRPTLIEDDVAAQTVYGDFMRVQTENLPSAAGPAAVTPLQDNALGHHVAFVYFPAQAWFVLQASQKLREGLVEEYMSAAAGGGVSFHFEPILSAEGIALLANHEFRKVEISVARLEKLPPAARDDDRLLETIRSHRDVSGASSMSLVLSMGHHPANLHNNFVVNGLRDMFDKLGGRNIIKKLKVTTEDGGEALNILGQTLRETETLGLPDNDPDYNRAVRINFVRRAFHKHRAFLATYV